MMVFKQKSSKRFMKIREQVDEYNRAFDVYRKQTGRNWVNKVEAKKFGLPKDVSNRDKSQLEVYEFKKIQRYFTLFRLYEWRQ